MILSTNVLVFIIRKPQNTVVTWVGRGWGSPVQTNKPEACPEKAMKRFQQNEEAA